MQYTHSFDQTLARAISVQNTSNPPEAFPDRTKVAQPIIRIRIKKKAAGFIDLPKPSKLSTNKSAPTSSAKTATIDDLLPDQAKDEEKPAASIVFQGKQMREDAGWLDRIFFSYAQPLLYSSMKERITFD